MRYQLGIGDPLECASEPDAAVLKSKWDSDPPPGRWLGFPGIECPSYFIRALLHETRSAVLASWFFGLRFFCDRIGLGFGQREQSVKYRTTQPCFGLLVG